MQKKLWYNNRVVAKFEKKDQPLALRVPLSLLKRIGEISEREDRPVGYVARELMVRGLHLYNQDGKVRNENGSKIGILSTTLKDKAAPKKRRIG